MIKIDRDWLRAALSDISTFGQIGFTIVVPPVVLCLIGSILVKKNITGSWVYIAAIALGLVVAFNSIVKLCKFFIYKAEKKNEKKKRIVSFREHD